MSSTIFLFQLYCIFLSLKGLQYVRSEVLSSSIHIFPKYKEFYTFLFKLFYIGVQAKYKRN